MKETCIEKVLVIDELPDPISADLHQQIEIAIRRLQQVSSDLSVSTLERNRDILAVRGLLKQLVTTLENRCNQMLASYRKKAESSGSYSAEDDAWMQRVERLQRAIESELESFGVTTYQPSGEVNPERDTVLSTVAGTGQTPGTVVEVIQNGYLWRSEVLMPSRVNTAAD